jgi:hypothetical protein
MDMDMDMDMEPCSRIPPSATAQLMFHALHDKYRSAPAAPQPYGPRVFTATVGRKPSGAKAYLTETEDVVDLLEQLTQPKSAGRPQEAHGWAASKRL